MMIPCFLKESPKFYVQSKKDDAKALESLRTIYPEEHMVELALIEIKREQEILNSGSLPKFISWWKNFWRLQLVAIVVAMTQQLTGISTILSWSTKIFTNGGVTDYSARTWSLMMGICFFIGTLAIPFIIIHTRMTLRKLFLSGTLAIVVILIALGILINTKAFLASRIIVLIYMLAYSGTVGSMMYVILADILPASNFSITLALNSIVYFAVSFTYLYFADSTIGTASPFYVYAGLTFLGFLYLTKELPETKGKALSDVLKEYKYNHKSRTAKAANVSALEDGQDYHNIQGQKDAGQLPISIKQLI